MQLFIVVEMDAAIKSGLSRREFFRRSVTGIESCSLLS